MEEIQVVMKRFGDEQSTLLDRFERLSVEVQLNQAILGRSLSVPLAPSYQPPMPPRRGSGFKKVMKKLFKPIFGTRKEERKDKNSKFIKAFSRSMRA